MWHEKRESEHRECEAECKHREERRKLEEMYGEDYMTDDEWFEWCDDLGISCNDDGEPCGWSVD